MDYIKLKNGKGFRRPASFVHLSSSWDSAVVKEANDEYSNESPESGIQHIDGFFAFMKDYESITKGLNVSQTSFEDFEPDRRSIRQRIFEIDPGFDLLLRGSKAIRKQMLKLKFFDESIESALVEIIGSRASAGAKSEQIIKRVYPKIDITPISKSLEFQIKNRTDILIFPSVPLTSSRHLNSQISKAKQMFDAGRIYLSDVLDRKEEKIDTMNLLTLNASILKADNFSRIFSLFATGRPSHLGLRVIYMHERNDIQVRALMRSVQELYRFMASEGNSIPISVMFLDQLGYISFCYGASSIVMPLAKDPYFYPRRDAQEVEDDESEHEKIPNGSYYHPKKFQIVSYDDLLEETRPKYRLPCYCQACTKYKTIPSVLSSNTKWNRFRRIHDILCKNIELKELHESRVKLHQSLFDMFSRPNSARLAWTEHIPKVPIYAFR